MNHMYVMSKWLRDWDWLRVRDWEAGIFLYIIILYYVVTVMKTGEVVQVWMGAGRVTLTLNRYFLFILQTFTRYSFFGKWNIQRHKMGGDGWRHVESEESESGTGTEMVIFFRYLFIFQK